MVSIVIPIYNTAAFLRQCLDSLIAQTHADWEAILVDDASTDNSAEIAAEYCSMDSRFRLIRQAHNKGQSAARNLGMTEITGEYLAFVDSDDRLQPDYLETLISQIGDADLLQTGYKRVTADGKVLEEKCPTWRTRYTHTTPWARLYRTQWIQNHHLTFKEGMIYEDVLFSAKVWKEQPKMRVYRYTGYLYSVNPQSTTSQKHDTRRIFRELREQNIHLLQFNALRVRLRAYFIKGQIFRK